MKFDPSKWKTCGWPSGTGLDEESTMNNNNNANLAEIIT